MITSYNSWTPTIWGERCFGWRAAWLVVQEVVDREECGAAELQIPSQILFFSTIVTFEGLTVSRVKEHKP
jgi:hypothetical protein